MLVRASHCWEGAAVAETQQKHWFQMVLERASHRSEAADAAKTE